MAGLRLAGWRCVAVLVLLDAPLVDVVLGGEDCAYVTKVWQTGDGLPQDSGTSIVQTPGGYLWLATFNGLVRFDGARLTVFDDGNTSALPSSRLVRLDVDPEGALWIISQEGALTRFQQGRFKRLTSEDGLPAGGAAAVVRGPNHGLLMLGRNGGVYRVDGERLEPDARFGFLRDAEASLFTDGQDQVWAWSRKTRALGRVVDGHLDLLKGPEGLSEARVRSYAFSREGGLWLVVSNRVWHYQAGQAQLRPTDWVLPDSVRGLTCALEDHEGNLWLSTFGQGLFRCGRSGGCRQFGTTEGLSHMAVRALCVDQEGGLWAGTDGGGLNRLKPRLVTMYDTRRGLTSEVVMSVVQSRQDAKTLWVGLNGGGLNQLRAGRVTALSAEPLLATNSYIYSVFETRQGELWLGTYSQGVLRYFEGELKHLADGPEWVGRPLMVTLEDRAGRIWAGGAGGLLGWQGRFFTNHNAELGWSNVTVSALAEDRTGNLYVGTLGHGLSRRSGSGWTHFLEQDGLADDHINALYVDRQDTVWIGTVNRGLSLFRNGAFVTLSRREGLPDNAITTILEDDFGNFWLGSHRGIFRVPAAQVKEFAAGRRRVVTGSTYGLGEGLSTLECAGGCKASDGTLWFSTARGLATIDPRRLPVNVLVPPVVIESVLIDGREPGAGAADERQPNPNSSNQLAYSRTPGGSGARGRTDSSPSVVVPPRHDRIEFRFTALSLLAPERVRFRYRLDGVDRDWLEGGTARVAYYSRLPAGRYRFQVTACNNDSVWNEAGAALSVVVQPAWWMTWWFRALACAAVAGSAFWAVAARLRRATREHAVQRTFSRRLIQTQEEERKRIAAGLHDSLGQDLLVIKNRALLGLQETAVTSKSAEQFTEISRLATASLAEVRAISHDLRPYQLDRLGLTKALLSMATSVSGASGLRCVAQIAPLDGLLAEPLEIHCYRIVQELLNNIIKHSRASEARINAAFQDHKVLLVISDDGCGFDTSAVVDQPRGAGLIDIAERVRILGGTLRCESRQAEGTRWSIEIPVSTSSPA